MKHTNDHHRLLERYADGELTGKQLQDAEALVTHSPELRARVAQQQHLRARVSQVIRSEAVPPSARQRVLSRLTAVSGRDRWLRLRPSLLAAAAVILLSLAVSIYSGNRWWSGEDDHSRVSLADFVRVHNECASSKQHDPQAIRELPYNRAVARLATMVKFPIAVPDLTRRGFDLRGACLCMTENQPRILHAYYESRATPRITFSLFSADREIQIGAYPGITTTIVTPSVGDRKAERSYRSIVSGDLTLLQWNEARQSLVLCGHVGEMVLRDIARDISLNNRKLHYQARVER